MHCYACNCSLSNPPIDKPTGRVYCQDCFAPTVEIQLSQQKDWVYEPGEIENLEPEELFIDIETEVEVIDHKELNEYF